MAVLRYCLLALMALVLAVQAYPRGMDPRKREMLSQVRKVFMDTYEDSLKEVGWSMTEFEDLYMKSSIEVARDSGDFDKQEIELMKGYIQVFFKMVKYENYQVLWDYVNDHAKFRNVAQKMASENFRTMLTLKIFSELMNDK